MNPLNFIKDRFFSTKPAIPKPVVEQKVTPLQKYLRPSMSDCHHNLSLGLLNEMLNRMFFSGKILKGLSKDLIRSLFEQFGHEWYIDDRRKVTGCNAYVPFDTVQQFKIKESDRHGKKSIGFRTYLLDFHRQLFNSRQNQYTSDGLIKEYHVFAVIVLSREQVKKEEYSFPVVERKYFTVKSYGHSSKEYHYDEISLGEFEDLLSLEDEAL